MHEHGPAMPSDRAVQDGGVTLPPSHAFVVQFRAETAIEHGHYAGRVEHVLSGQATPFHTLKELLEFLARVLANMRTHTSDES